MPDEAPPGPSAGSLAPRGDPCACGRRLLRGGERREAQGLWRREERRKAAAAGPADCFDADAADAAATAIVDSLIPTSAAAAAR